MSSITPPTESQKRHSVTFFDPNGTNEKDTWNTWHLIPAKKPVVPLPEPRFSSIELLGAHGRVDTSGILLNPISSDYPYGVTYDNRQGSWEFYVEDYSGSFTTFEAVLHNIATEIHGKYKKIVLRSDPNYAYYGRFKIEDSRTDEHWSAITVWFDLEPFAVGPGGTSVL